MRACYWIVLVLEMFPTIATAQRENPFTNLARATFERERTGLARGFEPLDTTHMGILSARERDSLRVPLEGGWEYLAVGICDDDCGNLNFYLLDPQARQLSVDVWSNRRPHVQLKVNTPGNYTLVAGMGSCSVPPCYYSVQWYRRPLAP